MIQLARSGEQAMGLALARLLDGGTLTIYGGSRPDDADRAPGRPALVVLKFADPAFRETADGWTARLDPTTASIGGRASWARLAQADGTPVMDCDVGTGPAAAIALNTTEFVAGGPIILSALTLAPLAS